MGRGRQPERSLATILFTDIVGSTDLASRIGDKEWRRLIAAHNARIRAQLKRFGGRELDTAGDGFLCSFDQPAQAVRAADAILAAVAPLGLTLRTGIHTGEAERIGGKLGGIAVHIAARIMAVADGGQVLVSSTVRDLVAGSRLAFTDAGTREFKGVPGEWHVYQLVREMPAAIEAALPEGIADSAEVASARRRRNFILAGIAALGILAILTAGVAVALLGAPRPAAIPDPGPDTVVAIDAASGKIVDVHAVQAGPVAIAYDPSTNRLWIASLDVGVVSDFAVAAGQQGDRTTGRVGRPTDLVVGEGVIWVADAFNQTVTLIDAATGQPRATVEDVVARHIAYGAGSAWATDDIADQVLRLDRQSGRVAQSVDLDAGAYPTGVAANSSAVWIGNSGLSTVTRLDATNATVVQSGIALRAVPDAIAVSDSQVWIAGREDDVVVRIDPNSNSVSQSVPVGDQPVSIAVDGDNIWVGCAGAEQAVWQLDVGGNVLAKVKVGGVPSDIAVGNGRVYVTVRQQ